MREQTRRDIHSFISWVVVPVVFAVLAIIASCLILAWMTV